MLSELEEVQGRYNDLVEKALEKKSGVSYSSSRSSAPASQRIRRTTTHTNNLDILNEIEEF